MFSRNGLFGLRLCRPSSLKLRRITVDTPRLFFSVSASQLKNFHFFVKILVNSLVSVAAGI